MREGPFLRFEIGAYSRTNSFLKGHIALEHTNPGGSSCTTSILVSAPILETAIVHIIKIDETIPSCSGSRICAKAWITTVADKRQRHPMTRAIEA